MVYTSNKIIPITQNFKPSQIVYAFLICLLGTVLPVSFWYMNQEHGLVYNFMSPAQMFDTFNSMMMGLSGWVGAFMLLVSFKYTLSGNDSNYLFLSCVLGVTIISMSFFSTNHLFYFYMSFEASIFPTLMLIMKWGYQPERLQASYYFVMYTVCASLPLLLYLLSFVTIIQSYSFLSAGFSFYSSKNFVPILCLSAILAFLVKAPLWGVHLWLPKAHVEAPVSGSMVLAGILLKLGGYGLIKLSMTNTLKLCWLNNVVISVGVWGLLVVSLVCLRQTDMKMMIAYSSVIHMTMMILGLLSSSVMGYMGAMTMMIIHGFASPGLFIAANFNYESTNSRNLLFQKGLHLSQPTAALVWFTLVSCNMAAPPFLSLGSELLIIASVLKLGFWLSLLLALTTLLSLTYNLFLFSSQQGSLNLTSNCNYTMRSYLSLTFLLHLTPISVSIMTIHLF